MICLEKSYEKVVDFVQDQILDGVYSTGDKLPSERELAQQLNFCPRGYPYIRTDGSFILSAGFRKLHNG